MDSNLWCLLQYTWIHGHWAVEFENGDSFYNLLEMCTVLRTADEEDSADLLKTFTLLKNEMEEQGMDIRHIDSL